MSHTEYIVETVDPSVSITDILWASMAVVTLCASIYTYVLPRFRKPMKTF